MPISLTARTRTCPNGGIRPISLIETHAAVPSARIARGFVQMKTFNSKLSRLFFLTCLLTVVGCSGTGVNPPSPESGYRFDNLPDAGKEDAAISDYRAISSWDKFDITFAFLDGTEK